MKQFENVAELRVALAASHRLGLSVGLVATMGYLHGGHAALLKRCREENDQSVLTIFVNPTQFGPSEDLKQYPRDLPRDLRIAESCEVDVVFTPNEETMYPGGAEAQRIWIDLGGLNRHLCGASRPGHFRGVATVVTKLFNLVEPDRAYFGQKDGQQAIIVRHLARELAFPIEISIVATEREEDGLALSSRNAYLLPEERNQATILYQSLTQARNLIERGERVTETIINHMRNTLSHANLASVDYVAIADQTTLQPMTGRLSTDAIIAVAVYFGDTRLIDNIIVKLDGPRVTFPEAL